MIETELKRHQQSVSTRSPCCVTWNADDQDDGMIADFDFDDTARALILCFQMHYALSPLFYLCSLQ